MTPLEAQKILSAYRPGDPDALSKDVREALDLVAALPDLGAWWAREQAFDRAFGKKLASVEPPPELKEAIVRGGATIITAQRLIDDSAMEGANAKTTPTAGDEKIIPFSEDDPFAEKARGAKTPSQPSIWRRRGWAFSMAATALIAIFAASLFIKPQKLAGDDMPSLARDMSYLVAGGVPPQWPSQNLDSVNTFLSKNHSPAPAALPVRAGTAKLVGGSVEPWHNHTVTHLFLQTPKSIIHLFIVEHAEFPDEAVGAEPKTSKQGALTVTLWEENDRIYMMLSTE